MKSFELPDDLRRYLSLRFISNEVIDAMNIKGVDHANRRWIGFPIFDEQGMEQYMKLKALPDDKEKPKAMTYPAGNAATLYPLHLLSEAKRIFICEGEPDCCVLLSNNIEAITSTHGAGTFMDEWVELFPRDIEVILSFDLDVAGRNAETKIAKLFQEMRKDITLKRVVLPKDLGVKGDITDLAKKCFIEGTGLADVLNGLVEDISFKEEKSDIKRKNNKSTYKAVTTCLADVEMEEVEWIWEGRMPRGKLVLIDGDPGLGKSWLSYSIASDLSTGKALPGQQFSREPENVLLLTAEDGLGDTVKPRLESLGADTSYITAIEAVVDEEGKEAHLSLADHLESLEAEITSKKYALIIIDPINAYLGSQIDTYRDSDIRSVLSPLIKMADKHKVAILCIRHLTKSQGGKAIYRGLGTIGYTAAARVVHIVAKHPEIESQCVIACIKNNLAAPPPPLAFTIQDGVFTWIGETDISIDDLMGDNRASNQHGIALEEAKEYLLENLSTEEGRSVREVQKEANDFGISKRTLDRAKADLNIKPVKEGFGKGSKWVLKLPKGAKVLDVTDGNL